MRACARLRVFVSQLSALRYVIDSPAGRRAGYTHLWKLDSDLDFGLFHLPAFTALLAFSAPFASQPAILPMARGLRSTDRMSLQARFAGSQWQRTGGPTLEVLGRSRLDDHGAWTLAVDEQASRPYSGRSRAPADIETMCPCLDAALLPAVRAAIAPLHASNEIGVRCIGTPPTAKTPNPSWHSLPNSRPRLPMCPPCAVRLCASRHQTDV